MLDSLESAREALAARFAWLPPNVAGVVVLAIAVLAGLVLHGLLRGVIQRLPRGRYLASLFTAAAGVTRFAMVIVVMILFLPIAPFTPDATLIVAKALVVAIIVAIGWAAIVAVGVGAEFYLRRFHTETEDSVLARKHLTQIRILKRAVDTLIVLLTIGFALMTFEPVRQYGISLFASAGVAGLVVGLAARPLLSSLIAGVQIAITQPIRLDDTVLIEGEWGWVEEITSTYVVIKQWDRRRLVVPLSYFIEKPFQNWTREGAAVTGSVFIHADYTVPVDRVREKLTEIVRASGLWDGDVASLQVTEAGDKTLQLRALVSARNASLAWDLRCEVREKLIAFLQAEYPLALPRNRNESVDAGLSRRDEG